MDSLRVVDLAVEDDDYMIDEVLLELSKMVCKLNELRTLSLKLVDYSRLSYAFKRDIHFSTYKNLTENSFEKLVTSIVEHNSLQKLELFLVKIIKNSTFSNLINSRLRDGLLDNIYI